MEPTKSAPRLVCVSLVLVVIALLVTACGGSTSTASSGASPTETAAVAINSQDGSAAWIANADAICGRINSELAAAKSVGTGVSETVRVISRHASIEQQGVRALAALKPTESLRLVWPHLIEDRRTLAHELVELARATQSKDNRVINELAVSKEQSHKLLLAIAVRSGFKVCGQVG